MEIMPPNTWIDLPIINAIEYFQSILSYFLNFTVTYGNFFGLIGLIWTAIRLVNSRIDMRSAWWDSLSKWLVFILLLNFYPVATTSIATIANEIGISAGPGTKVIIKNLTSLKSRIESNLKLRENWAKGLIDIVNNETGIKLDYITNDDEITDLYKSAPTAFQMYKFESSEQNHRFQKAIEEHLNKYPGKQQSIWGEQTLEALNEILIYKSDDKNNVNLTGSYVVDKPSLNIWLKDNENKATQYLSGSAFLRIGVLITRIIWEKSQMVYYEDESNEDNKKDNKRSWSKAISATIDRLLKSIMAMILNVGIIVAVIFAIIQYVMCILEFIIIQGIGAAFIPFYLFDGTKDIPKKLVPVYIGLVIKIIVMIICFIFVINLYLIYAGGQISPSSGQMGWESFAEGLFIIIISFILTSNAPKIAMTLLTGQPQLSMGEFVAAAGTLAAGAVAAKNAATTVASPLSSLAKDKARQWSERYKASTGARQNQENKMKQKFAENEGIDTSTRSGRKELNKKWDVYKNSDENREGIRDEIKKAGQNAYDKTSELQKNEYIQNGGLIGSSGRMLAFYTGAGVDIVKTLKEGKKYKGPESNIDPIKMKTIMDDSVNNEWTIPKTSNDMNQTDNDNKYPRKNNLPEDPNVGTRQID